MAYKISFDSSEIATLDWLSDRGYDGDFMNLSSLVSEGADGSQIRELSEENAFNFYSNVSEDESAFLTCSGSFSLNQKMLSLYSRIV